MAYSFYTLLNFIIPVFSKNVFSEIQHHDKNFRATKTSISKTTKLIIQNKQPKNGRTFLLEEYNISTIEFHNILSKKLYSDHRIAAVVHDLKNFGKRFAYQLSLFTHRGSRLHLRKA